MPLLHLPTECGAGEARGCLGQPRDGIRVGSHKLSSQPLRCCAIPPLPRGSIPRDLSHSRETQSSGSFKYEKSPYVDLGPKLGRLHPHR